jgi:HlyD family secretion protein
MRSRAVSATVTRARRRLRSEGETVEPRMTVLGLNDWDHTEVIRGLEPGEEVVLISVARLQQQQQDMLNRMRERTSGPFPGAGGGPGGRR